MTASYLIEMLGRSRSHETSVMDFIIHTTEGLLGKSKLAATDMMGLDVKAGRSFQ